MSEQSTSAGTDLGLLTLRMSVGGLMAGHGAQKLFGSFGGYGLEGTAGWLESLGLRPGKLWAALAGGGEFGSGVLIALGLMHPVGPLTMFGPMIMAWAKAHAGKPIWVTSGGAELPLLNMTAATALLFSGPGRLSLDRALGITVPRRLVALTIAGVAAGVVAGLMASPQQKDTEDALTGPAGGEGSPAAAPVERAIGDTDPARRSTATGTVTYGGMATNMDLDGQEQAREIGADPPGSLAPGLRPAAPNYSPLDEPAPPRD